MPIDFRRKWFRCVSVQIADANEHGVNVYPRGRLWASRDGACLGAEPSKTRPSSDEAGKASKREL